MFINSKYISKIISIKNVKTIDRSFTLNRDKKILEFINNHNNHKNNTHNNHNTHNTHNKNKYYKNKSILVNYKNKPKSIIVYDKPKTELMVLQKHNTLPSTISAIPIDKNNTNMITNNDDIKYYKLTLLSVTGGLCVLSIFSYGYLICNNLELLLLL